jgi:hydrogenase expression/formation protein HypC
MCLAVPMKLVTRDGQRGTVDMSGAQKEIMLTLVPDAAVGQWLIVHAGYALEVLDEVEAQRTLDLIRQMGESES